MRSPLNLWYQGEDSTSSTTVLFPRDVGFVAQDTGAFHADLGHGHKGADVEAHSVVEVGVPANRLLFQRFPANEDVVRGFSPWRISSSFLLRFSAAAKRSSAPSTPRSMLLLLTADPVA